MNFFNKIVKDYNKYPLWIITLLSPFFHLLPVSKRMGKYYKKEMNTISTNANMSTDQIINRQNELFCSLIKYSYEHVRYYKNLFDSIGLVPADFQTVKDIVKIPFLTKDILLKNRDDLISDEFKKTDLSYITTSGSTGVPAGFYVQSDSAIRDIAYTFHFFRDIGYNAKSSKLLLRGKRFYNQKKGKKWQWDPLKKELCVDIFSMTNENMEIYCNAIEKYKPDFAYGYMSAMYYLCKYLKSRKKPLRHHFKGFISISESFSDLQKSFVESVIKSPVVSFYGMSERVVIAKMCNKSGHYHIEPLYGYAEIIDKNGNPITDNNIVGEIVGTSLLNYGMPLIRYKTGDMSSWSDSDCNCHNAKWTLGAIYGRKNEDALVNCDLQPISMASLEVHSYVYNSIKRYQFYQDQPGVVIIKIVPVTSNIDEKIKEDIVRLFEERTNRKICFEVEIVNELRPKKNGKFSILDQRLKLDDYARKI